MQSVGHNRKHPGEADSVTECRFNFLLKSLKDAESNVFLAFGPFGPARIQLVAAMEEQRYVHPTQYMQLNGICMLLGICESTGM